MLLAALAAVAAAVYILFCELTGSMPRCVFKWLTGFDCPGCGSQRAFHALLRGDFLQAWSFNFLLPFLAAYLLLILLLPLSANPRLRCFYDRLTSPAACLVVLVAVIAWWIIRNIIPIPEF